VRSRALARLDLDPALPYHEDLIAFLRRAEHPRRGEAEVRGVYARLPVGHAPPVASGRRPAAG